MNKKVTYISIGAVVVLILILGGIAWGIMNTRANLTPEKVTENFLKGWAQVAMNSAGSPVDEGLHRKSTYVTDAFGNSVESKAARHEGEAFDPVFCMVEPTEDISVSVARISEQPERTRASITVEAHSETASSQSLDIVLIKDEKGWWRIDEIDCTTLIPRPQIG